MSVRVEGLWACGVHTPETAGVVCGACHESALRRAREEGRSEGRAEAKEENTRLRGEVEQARQTAEKWAAEVTRLRREAVEKDATNTPLKERLAALEGLLSEGKKCHRCMRCRGIFECRTSGCAARFDVLPMIVRADGSMVEHECAPTPPPSASQSDKTPFRQPSAAPPAPQEGEPDAAPQPPAARCGCECHHVGGCGPCCEIRAAAPKAEEGLGECVGHLGPPSNTATPHPRGGTCSFWRPLAQQSEERGSGAGGAK